MATKTKITIITLDNLNKTIKNMQKTFAPINITNEIIDTKVSAEQPTDQNIGDIWFVEQERN